MSKKILWPSQPTSTSADYAASCALASARLMRGSGKAFCRPHGSAVASVFGSGRKLSVILMTAAPV